MAKESNIVRITTGAGIAKYCFINEPQTTFDPNGVYNILLVMSEEDANKPLKSAPKGLMQTLSDQMEISKEQAFEKAKPQNRGSLTARPPFQKEYDDQGMETGNIEFRFKMTAKFTDREGVVRERKPTIYDAQRNILEESVGSGSKLKVAFNARPYYMPSNNSFGVSLFLSAVQVLELAVFDANDFEDEDGYVAPARPTEAPANDFVDDEFDS